MMKWSVILLLIINQLVKQSISKSTASCTCQAEILKYKNKYLQCTVSKSCQNNCGVPVMKILTESSENTASSFGKFIKLNNSGVLVALCYIKVDNNGCDRDYDWIVKTYRISSNQQSGNNSFSINEFGENDEPNFIANDPEGNVTLIDQSNDRYVVSCRHTYSVNRSQELHQLFRILPNKESFKVLIDAANITGTISEDNKLVTIEYKHSFKYAAEYFNNRFECRFVDKFTEHSQSRMTHTIIRDTKCNRLKIHYENSDLNPVDMSKETKQIYETWPPRMLKCTCNNVAYPEPEIIWSINYAYEYTWGKYLRASPNAIFCCRSKQTLQSGENHIVPSCITTKQSNVDPWIVIQRRIDGSVSFNRTWTEYKNGFGDLLLGEFWLGNDKLHQLTSAAPMKIRFDLWDRGRNHVYAEYSSFYVASESDNYRLSIGEYSGNASDSMNYHNKMEFSTKDRDNDKWSRGSCSQRRGGYGGWWFNYCKKSNLNGEYYEPGRGYVKGVIWYYWKNQYETMRWTTIKIAYT